MLRHTHWPCVNLIDNHRGDVHNLIASSRAWSLSVRYPMVLSLTWIEFSSVMSPMCHCKRRNCRLACSCGTMDGHNSRRKSTNSSDIAAHSVDHSSEVAEVVVEPTPLADEDGDPPLSPDSEGSLNNPGPLSQASEPPCHRFRRSKESSDFLGRCDPTPSHLCTTVWSKASHSWVT